ncbi:GNAT family N-acetyltransferase [Paenibacillus sp. HB172176]|uniref:GNAT family N-acetyltransferase n=1 Tax=Paenibacillus sp. HB172176 TaxID=2493690 RepID=UPI00143A32D0|nr:GNAT family N-acetyltransferase [Paenibacillus sp. HB172176]
MNGKRNVAVLVYEKVDLLDFVGPFDVFGLAGREGVFHVYTVGEKQEPLNTVSGLTILPKYSFNDCPKADILIVPGGLGSRAMIHHAAVIDWIRCSAEGAEMILSVCTGALLLAKAGLLNGLKVTTNRRAFDLLRELLPSDAMIAEEVRYVDNGKVITSGGVTTGFDAALHAVSRLCGEQRAIETASRLEYRWSEALEIRVARAEDAADIIQLYREASRWICEERGVNQWREETFTERYVQDFLREKEVFVACMQGELVACFSIEWEDAAVWGERNHHNAGYVHRLAVSRKLSGLGIGRRLLTWSRLHIKGRGKSWLRLDCMADNPALNQYYLDQGFRCLARVEGKGWSANLYEMEC